MGLGCVCGGGGGGKKVGGGTEGGGWKGRRRGRRGKVVARGEFVEASEAEEDRQRGGSG